MLRRWILAAALGAIGSMAGCGSSSSDSGGGGSISISDLPGEIAKTECNLLAKCLGPAIDVLLGGEDCVKLTTSQVDNGGLAQLQSEVDSGKVKYDAAKAKACINELAGRSCAELDNRTSATCDQAVEGSTPEGGDCSYDFECQGLNYCKFSGACPGKCAAREAAGSNCDKNDNCQDGLICSKQNSTCVKPAGVAEACGGGVAPDCASGLLCTGDDAQTQKAGTCKAATDLFSGKAGETCSYAAGPLCSGDLVCVYSAVTGPNPSGTCQAKVASGAACKRVAIPSQCPSGEYCDGVDPSLDGNCKTAPAANQPCAKTPIGNVCAAYTRCQNGTCVALQDNGGPCSQANVCYSEQCINGACKVNSCN